MCYFVFFLSIQVTSDELPERVEKELHKYIRGRYTHNTDIVTLAVNMYGKKDIYGEHNEIDHEKLTVAMDTHQTIEDCSKKIYKLTFLSKKPYGVEVLAFLIQRYHFFLKLFFLFLSIFDANAIIEKQELTLLHFLFQRHNATARAVRTIAKITTDTYGEATNQTKKTRRKKVGGGEVYDMFRGNNCCVLTEGFFSQICDIARKKSDTNYFTFSHRGKVFLNEVVNDIQQYMDAYYKSRKCNFPKKLYPNANEFMEVYIKTMYLIQRGFLQSENENDHRMDDDNPHPVNIVWDDIGMFRLFVWMYLCLNSIYIYIYYYI